MKYIVSGYGRSGTSMMMKMMEAGGMDCLYDREDLYELDKIRVEDDKVTKVVRSGVKHLPLDEYNVIFMLRSPKAISKSAEEFWGGDWDETIIETTNNIFLRYCNSRTDMKVIPIWYEECVSNIVGQLAKIKEAGWNINIDKASAVIKERKKDSE